MSHGSSLTFNLTDGYLEAVIRGFKGGILNSADYQSLVQCESLEDVKLALSATDYGHFLQNEPLPLHTTIIQEKCTERLAQEFFHIKHQANEPLKTFLNYCSFAYMIDNIVLLLNGTLHGRDPDELLESIHPLGDFPTIASLCTQTTAADLYEVVLVDTPIAPYFKNCITEEDLSEENIEIIRNKLFKEYLDDFYDFCARKLGGVTGEVMGEILAFEADRRAINITINSFETNLTGADRRDLFPICGHLCPGGLSELEVADDYEQVKATLDKYLEFKRIFQDVALDENKSLEDGFFEKEVELNKLSFEQQFHYGIFYSYLRLKEQEIRNIVWISECIAQDKKPEIDHFVSIF